MNDIQKDRRHCWNLFIIGTISGILSGCIYCTDRAGSTYPTHVAANETQWIIGTLFILLMGLSLAMVPVAGCTRS